MPPRARADTPAQGAQPVRQPAAGQAATPPGARKKGGKIKWIGAGILLFMVFLYTLGLQDQQEQQANKAKDCDSAFDLGSKAVAGGDLPGARTHALRAAAACGEDQRAKIDALQGAIAAAEKTDDACLRSFRAIESQIQDGRLQRARAGLGQLKATCAAKSVAEDLRKQLNEAQAAGRAATADMRSALDARDAVQARAALDKLTGLNREDPNLDRLNAELKQLSAALAAEQEASTAAAAAPPVDARPPVAAAGQRASDRPPVSSRNADAGGDARSSMASAFLRDAEQALAHRKFDAARTYVDSARRIDPDDPRLDSLTQQIRERERQMLQQETTIR